MRILCLNLQQTHEPSCAEIFLKISPRVQFRYPHYVFIDIESTTGYFGGEGNVLKKSVELARTIAPKATGAIADSPPVAQMMVHHRPFDITKPGEDIKTVSKLPTTALCQMEGLEVWSRKKPIEHIVNFFKVMGMEWIEDVYHFQEASFRERWGEAGILLWKRLHGQDFQVISPLCSQDALSGYAYFDDPVDLIPTLMQKMRPQLHLLFLRLEGLGRFAQKLEITLFCEYSEKRHVLQIEPVSPSRDFKLFEDLFLAKLETLDLDNPVREFEVQVFDQPEKIQQLDFFQPRDSSEDRWRRLISFASQAEIEMGFLQMEHSHFPEASYSLKTDWPKDFSSQDSVEKSEGAIQVKAVYSKGLAQSPRPSLLLKEPLLLSKFMMKALKILTRFPTERIQSSWWKKSSEERDYYFALSRKGQLLWVYRDLSTENYYLHGYFD
jgi:protein ImuB